MRRGWNWKLLGLTWRRCELVAFISGLWLCFLSLDITLYPQHPQSLKQHIQMMGCNNSFPLKEKNWNLTCKFCFRKIWDKGWLCLVFFFLLSYYHIFLFSFNFNTTDYFWASVIYLIRKYYIHISWKEGGGGWKGLGYDALSCSFIPHSRT